jgi:hypothetical protein
MILSRICPVSQVLRDPTGGWRSDYWREAEVAAAARELTLLMLPIFGLKRALDKSGAWGPVTGRRCQRRSGFELKTGSAGVSP